MASTFGSNEQFGSDIIFTYGPLGFLELFTQNETTIHFKIWHQVISRLVFCFFAAVVVSRLTPRWVALSWLCLLIVLTPYLSVDGFYALFAIFAFYTLTVYPASRWLTVFIGMLCGYSMLIKFTTLALFVLLSGVQTFVFLLKKRYVQIVLFNAGVSAVLLAGWFFCGQSAAAFANFVINGLEMASGYQSMSLETPGGRVIVIVKWLLLFPYAVLLTLVAMRLVVKLRSSQIVWMAALLAGAFLMWKHSIIRADLYHISGIFVWVALTTPLLRHYLSRESWLHSYVPHRVLAVGFTGITLFAFAYSTMWNGRFRVTEDKGRWFFSPSFVMENLSQIIGYLSNEESVRKSPVWQNQHDQQLREIIGNDSVDFHGYRQDYLMVNKLNFQYRPVPQTYAAYTPKLTQFNAKYLSGLAAPKWIVADFDIIDVRFWPTEDSASVRSLLIGYKLEKTYNDMFFFKRSVEQISPLSAPIDHERDLKFGEEMQLPDLDENQVLWLSIDLKKTLVGKANSFLSKISVPLLHIKFKNGESMLFRLPESMAKTPFLISPAIFDEKSAESFFKGEDDYIVDSFRIERQGSSILPDDFSDTMAVKLQKEYVPGNRWSEAAKESSNPTLHLSPVVELEVNR